MTEDLFGEVGECRHKNVGLGFHYFSNGSEHLVRWCFDCKTRQGFGYVPRTELERLKLDPLWIPTVLDDRGKGEPCAVGFCDSRDTELHHWAPQSLADHFGEEWPHWPTVWLCRRHHALWHQTVTPGLTRVKVVLMSSALRSWAVI